MENPVNRAYGPMDQERWWSMVDWWPRTAEGLTTQCYGALNLIAREGKWTGQRHGADRGLHRQWGNVDRADDEWGMVATTHPWREWASGMKMKNRVRFWERCEMGVLWGTLYRTGMASWGGEGGEMAVAGGAPSMLWLLEGEVMGHWVNEGKGEAVGRCFDSSTRARGRRASSGARRDGGREGGGVAWCWRWETKATELD
jgi:hypothetical protein